MFNSNLVCMFRMKKKKIQPTNQTKIHVWENKKVVKTVRTDIPIQENAREKYKIKN